MKKKLIILGVVLVFGLFVMGISLMFQEKDSHKSVSEKFAKALIESKDAAKAFELTSDGFKAYTAQSNLESYLISVSDRFSSSKVAFQESIQKEVPEGYVETYTNTYTFTDKDGSNFKIVITTITDEGRFYVDSYSITNVGGES